MNFTDTTIDPCELNFLQEVFESVRQAKGIQIQSSDASNIAAHIIELYQSGVRDRQELQHVAQNGVVAAR